MSLLDFICESNRIEGIVREPTRNEIGAHEAFLDAPLIGVQELERFVSRVAGAPLRDKLAMDVRVGRHLPIPGGPRVRKELAKLCDYADTERPSPYELHVHYETLHPFMDGNGRSGRVWWAWYMHRRGLDPFRLPFLHAFYYQALDGARLGQREAAR